MIRYLLLNILIGTFLYGLIMMVVRLHLTQLAYHFDELKAYERSLKEEQLRLRAQISEALSPDRLKIEGFQEPQVSQVLR